MLGPVVVEEAGAVVVGVGEVVVVELLLQPATTRTTVSREAAMNIKDLVFIPFSPFIFLAEISLIPDLIN